MCTRPNASWIPGLWSARPACSYAVPNRLFHSKVIGSRACDRGRETCYSCEIRYRGSMAGYRYVDAKSIALGMAAVKTTGKL